MCIRDRNNKISQLTAEVAGLMANQNTMRKVLDEEVRSSRAARNVSSIVKGEEAGIRLLNAQEAMSYVEKMQEAIKKLIQQIAAKEVEAGKEKGEQTARQCPICMTEGKNYALSCGHTLCKECWVTVRGVGGEPRCPTCRKQVREYGLDVYI